MSDAEIVQNCDSVSNLVSELQSLLLGVGGSAHFLFEVAAVAQLKNQIENVALDIVVENFYQIRVVFIRANSHGPDFHFYHLFFLLTHGQLLYGNFSFCERSNPAVDTGKPAITQRILSVHLPLFFDDTAT